jgi:hypothetical protein
MITVFDINSPEVFRLQNGPTIGWDEVSILVNDLLSSARLRIIKNNGIEVPRDTFLKQNAAWVPLGFDACLDHIEVQRHWDQGATLMLAHAAYATDSISTYCKLIEESFDCFQCDAHIFISSRAGSRSFPKHYDESHNLIVPVEGKLLTMVYGCDDNSEKLLCSEILCPGQALFVPKGNWHQIQPIEKRISVSFPFAMIPNREPQSHRRIQL